jgi:23S rRNA (adenine2030-N6)-methyltransferase
VNYQHVFHAGNFADVFKHALLAEVLGRLCGKTRPVSYVETHSGAGCYRLDSPEALRSGEAREGVGRLSGYPARHPALVRYIGLIAALPENLDQLVAYPGSPLVAAGITRPQDRLHLAELAPGTAADLFRLFRHDDRVAVHRRDGYEAIGGLLPPSPRAGLVLIDPPYESPGDFLKVLEGLRLARRRWPEGALAAWYPIKDRRELGGFYRSLGGIDPQGVLRAEISLHPDDNAAGLNGCGMVVANPPWGLAESWGPLVAELAEVLGEKGAHRAAVDVLGPPADGP